MFSFGNESNDATVFEIKRVNRDKVMTVSHHHLDKLNNLIKVSIVSSSEPMTEALQIARKHGAFTFNNVVFQNYQLKMINLKQD